MSVNASRHLEGRHITAPSFRALAVLPHTDGLGARPQSFTPVPTAASAHNLKPPIYATTTPASATTPMPFGAKDRGGARSLLGSVSFSNVGALGGAGGGGGGSIAPYTQFPPGGMTQAEAAQRRSFLALHRPPPVVRLPPEVDEPVRGAYIRHRRRADDLRCKQDAERARVEAAAWRTTQATQQVRYRAMAGAATQPAPGPGPLGASPSASSGADALVRSGALPPLAAVVADPRPAKERDVVGTMRRRDNFTSFDVSRPSRDFLAATRPLVAMQSRDSRHNSPARPNPTARGDTSMLALSSSGASRNVEAGPALAAKSLSGRSATTVDCEDVPAYMRPPARAESSTDLDEDEMPLQRSDRDTTAVDRATATTRQSDQKSLPRRNPPPRRRHGANGDERVRGTKTRKATCHDVSAHFPRDAASFRQQVVRGGVLRQVPPTPPSPHNLTLGMLDPVDDKDATFARPEPLVLQTARAAVAEVEQRRATGAATALTASSGASLEASRPAVVMLPPGPINPAAGAAGGFRRHDPFVQHLASMYETHAAHVASGTGCVSFETRIEDAQTESSGFGLGREGTQHAVVGATTTHATRVLPTLRGGEFLTGGEAQARATRVLREVTLSPAGHKVAEAMARRERPLLVRALSENAASVVLPLPPGETDVPPTLPDSVADLTGTTPAPLEGQPQAVHGHAVARRRQRPPRPADPLRKQNQEANPRPGAAHEGGTPGISLNARVRRPPAATISIATHRAFIHEGCLALPCVHRLQAVPPAQVNAAAMAFCTHAGSATIRLGGPAVVRFLLAAILGDAPVAFPATDVIAVFTLFDNNGDGVVEIKDVLYGLARLLDRVDGPRMWLLQRCLALCRGTFHRSDINLLLFSRREIEELLPVLREFAAARHRSLELAAAATVAANVSAATSPALMTPGLQTPMFGSPIGSGLVKSPLANMPAPDWGIMSHPMRQDEGEPGVTFDLDAFNAEVDAIGRLIDTTRAVAPVPYDIVQAQFRNSVQICAALADVTLPRDPVLQAEAPDLCRGFAREWDAPSGVLHGSPRTFAQHLPDIAAAAARAGAEATPTPEQQAPKAAACPAPAGPTPLPIDPAAREALELHQRAEELRLREIRRAARARLREKSIGPLTTGPPAGANDDDDDTAAAPAATSKAGRDPSSPAPVSGAEDTDEAAALAGVGHMTKRFVVSQSTITVLTSAARAAAAARQRVAAEVEKHRRSTSALPGVSPSTFIGPTTDGAMGAGLHGVHARTSAALHSDTGAPSGSQGGRRQSLPARCNDGSLAADVFVDEERDAEEFAPPEYTLSGGFLQRMK